MERLDSTELTRLFRRQEGRTADDAVLTRTLPLIYRASGKNRSRIMVHGLIYEAAKPDVHYQADRHEHEQSGRAAVAHQRQRNAGHGHSAYDHGHIYQNVET